MENKQTSIYFIISCHENIEFKKEFIQISKVEILEKELIIILEKNVNYFDMNSKSDVLNGKNIYLFKIKIKLKNPNNSIKIKLSFLNKTFTSKNPINVKENKAYFIYDIVYGFEDVFRYWGFKIFQDPNIKDFLDNKFNVNYLTKLMIFKKYLLIHENSNFFGDLLECTRDKIIELEKIDYEFLLFFLITLIDKNDKFLNISKKFQNLFISVILHFTNIKEIIIREYGNNEYNKIIKIIEKFPKKFNNQDLVGLDLIILLFYQTNDKKNFKQAFKQIKYKKEVTKYIIEHSQIFNNYDSSELKLIYKNAEENQINIISRASNFNEYLKFFCLNFKKIINEGFYKYINFKKIPEPIESFDEKDLTKFIDSIIDTQIYFPIETFIELINKLEMKDYHKLINLKSIINKYEEYKENWKLDKINEELNKVIHFTGKKFIEEDKLNSLEIITFIQEDAKTFYYDYKTNQNFAILIGHINLDEIDKQFCNKFKGKNYDYKRLMNDQYKLFITSIIDKVKYFKHLKILYEIFDLKVKKDNEIISEIINILNNKALIKDDSELSEIIGILFQIVGYKNDNINLKNLIKGIKKNFSDEEINDILIKIINNKTLELNEFIIDKLINIITNNADNLPNNDIILLLNKFTDISIRKHFFEKQKKNLISEKELFNHKLSDNLKFIYDLIENGFFGEEYKIINYIKKTKIFMEKQINNLKEFNFTFQQLIILRKLNEENNLRKRLFIIALGDQKIVDDLFPLLINKINKCYRIWEQINQIINIFSNYYSHEENNTIQKYTKLNEEIDRNPISEFPDITLIDNFEEKFNKSDEIDKLKKSKIFIEIFELNKKIEKNENDSIIVDKTKSEFNNLKKLFNEQTEDDVDLNFLERILKKINSSEIDKEFKLLLEISNIEENNKNIFEKLKLLKNKNKNFEKVHKIILLLNDFNLSQKNIKLELEKAKEDLIQNPTLKKLMEIEINLNKLNLNILDSNLNEKSLIVINQMYHIPELINFIKDKTINDIHQMGEFIDDSEDVYLSLSDITTLESCKKFYEELNRCNSSEKEFLDNLINLVNQEDYKDIGMKFENSSSKYHDFHELYTNHLNPNELNKEHIKAIYEKSCFSLKQLYPLYDWEVSYSINSKNYSKDFDIILDLRDVALLRKKDQKEENYFSICENFAIIINQIQEILDILNIISSKGYYEELIFKIEINNGDCKVYQGEILKGDNLKNIYNELSRIREEQDNIVKEIYNISPIARMVYGKQFEFIYNYLINNKNDQNKINNIIKYVTNNIIKKDEKNINTYKEENKLKEMFKKVDNYLNHLYQINSINSVNIYEKAFLKNNKKNGIFSHLCSFEEIDVNAINCSLDLTGNFPIAQTVLYCNSSTSEEEIISFIYKSIKCDLNVLFILIKPEILNIEKKNLLIQLLKDLYSEDQDKMNSCLLFIYSKENKNKEVIIEIEKLPGHKYFNYENKQNQYNNIKFPNIEIYTSEFSGLGKSTLIKNNFKNDMNNNYEYIYFPIGGDINSNEIINRLLLLSNRKISLHLDLHNSNNIELIREFLFKFLILKFYSQKENFFFYGDEIKIKIEIPKSFIDFFDLFPILNYFEKINLTKENMPHLIVSDNILSNIQIVCNYFKYMEVLNEKDIFIKNLNIIDNDDYNCKKATPLDQEECSKLIFENINIDNPNYYQITSFINLIGEQLILFTNSIYLNINHLNSIKNIKKNLDNIRYFFVHSLTIITKHFITSSYDNILKGQEITYSQQKGKIDLEKAREESIKILQNKESFSIKNIPSMILINEDGQSISEIITCKENTEEYNLLKAIYNSDLPDEKRGVPDYSKMKPKDFLIQVKNVLNLFNPIDIEESSSQKEYKGKILRTIESIVGSYVFTSDNFIKLILISLRLRTNIPVIMMGETGCGKTSLIRIIAELKDIAMHILNIHAGIEDKDIINFLENKNLFENNINVNNDDTWVFLDEINTCNSLSLITEIMLKQSCKGRKIKQNVKFIAACNPYRLYEKEKEIIGLYDETKHSLRKLVYNVNPLPIPLLNFVFDFGTLNDNDIKKYISNILTQIIKNIINEKNNAEKIQEKAEKAIFDSQEFIKNNFEISSVSLREVRRWGILFEWFYNLFNIPFFKKYKNFSFDDIGLYSLNLSIYLCYYIRIYDKELRKDFCKKMKESFGDNFEFEEFPREIQDIIADSVELEKGIAKNRALLENLFSIFVCLNTKIPLFIIGKPGSSKSLSSQLIFKSMNGKDSSNEFFRNFPKVYIKPYQGSLTSTPKDVLKLFQKARKSLEDKKIQNEIISSIYFDEMGLAEISKNNPLKVIHSELEYDENKEKVAFIGISNWPLDASKMNRGIHLSITEPDEEDLIFTALEIVKSYHVKLVHDYKIYFEFLARTYFEYKNKLKNEPYDFDIQNNRNLREFHGSRDFYYLIKIASKLLVKSEFPKDNYEINNIINETIERNFGGLENSIKIFKQIFKKYVPNINEIKEYNVMDCIKDNIIDTTSRYLLIITKSSISHFLIKLILDDLKKKHIFYYGSNFEEDNLKGYYSAKVLNKIQITMSEDKVMILKNLTSMYPSLYDLFNLNFKRVGNSNYARIALGNSNTQNYFVNENFRCIVILDKNEIGEQDPPFINRFEKHIITFEYLLNENQVKMSKQIIQIFNSLIEKKNKELKTDLKFHLLNCDLEEIQGIVYQISEEKLKKEKNNNFSEEENKLDDFNIEEGEINTSSNQKADNSIQLTSSNLNIYKEIIFKKVIPTFSEDLIFYAKNSNFAQKYKEEFQNIIDIYFENQYEHQNLKSYLEKIEYNKHMIYTFSNILDSPFGLNNSIKIIKNKKFCDFTEKKTKKIFVEQINSEREIDEKILDFYSAAEYNLCIFHFNIEDCIHLNHINYLIDGNENNFNVDSKVILFVIHLKRKNGNEEENKIHNEYLISHLTKWKQFFIDNLSGKEINMKEVFESSNIELFNNNNLIDLDDEFKKDLYHSFSFISYNTKINFSNLEDNEYIQKIYEFINNDNNLKKMIQNLIKNKIKNIKDNLIIKVFTECYIEEEVDFISILIKYMKTIYNNNLIDIIINLEKNSILSTKLLNPDEMKNEFIDTIYEECINELDFSIENHASFSQMIKIDRILGISFPSIILIFKEINYYIYSSLIEKYLDNEDDFRSQQIEFEEYFDKKNNLENNLKQKFEKYYLSKIFNNNQFNLNKQKLGELLLKDYNIYYISKSNYNLNNKKILDFYKCLFELFLLRTENQEQIDEEYQNEEREILFSIENISKFVLFIESYKDYIYPLSEFICIFDLSINNFFEELISRISLKQFRMKNSKISYVNDIFFNIFESTVFCIFNINKKFEVFSDEDFNKFLNDIKLISNLISKANYDLLLTLKQYLYLLDFIQVKEIFHKNGIPLKKNMQIYLDLLKKENKIILNKEKNLDVIDEEFSFLKNKLSHLEEYPELIGELLNNKIKISKEEQYRLRLLQISFSNNKFIIKIKNIFEILLKKYKICPIDKSKINRKNSKEKEEEKNEENEEEENEEEENEYDKDGTGEIFLSQIEEDEDNIIIHFLNETNNICLDEILLSLFDGKLALYFENKSKEDLILNQSFEIFKKCVNYIENKEYKITNNKLGFLYCISYIKYYCFHYAKIIHDEQFQSFQKGEIKSFLNITSSFRNIIKIYILKILNLIFYKNYIIFLNSIEEKQIFFNDFVFKEKVPCSLDYLFLQNENFDFYKNLKEKYALCKMQKFRTIKDISELILNNDKYKNFIVFYDLLINEEISNLKANYQPEYHNKLSNFVLGIIDKLNLSEATIKVLSLFYKFDLFETKIYPLIKNIDESDYEILLYSHKFAVIMSNNKSIYSGIISQNILEYIKDKYIPGGEPNDSIKIESGEKIKKYFEENEGLGVYMCSCNDFYIVENCGKPTEQIDCPNCGQKIGGKNHFMVKRPGHFRIVNNEEKRKEMEDNKYGECKFLNKLMEEVEIEKNTHFKGFKKVKYKFFIKKNKNVRNMNNITYRILSFIFYSCVYYSEKLGFLNDLQTFFFIDEDEKKKDVLFILKTIWEILKEELIKREVNNIQCFLNMIIPELSKIILTCQKPMISINERDEFEILCNKSIENAISNYKNYYTIYKNNNNEILKIEDSNIKSILKETSDVTNLPQTDFPLINYFYTSNYPNYEQFLAEFDLISDGYKQYPVLTQYLKASLEGSIEYLKNFKYINPFVKYVLEKYSNKISREEAKKIKIKNELDKDNKMKSLFEAFKKGWENIYKDLSNYDCNGKLPEKNITENDSLAYCLNDILENDYGKYIANAYKDFITVQNNFLKPLIENNAINEYLYPYSMTINKEIIVQRATEKELVSLDISNNIYDSFEDLVYAFSYRNCFKENGDVYYLNYKQVKYDFQSIEIELSKILLSEKRLFCNEQNQEFITYAFECFNQNHCIILDFKDKINEIKVLTSEEKATFSKIIEKIDYKIILFNMQSLFLYFNEKININGNEILIEEIKNIPDNLNILDPEFINIFETFQFKIKLNKFIDCYEFVEFLNYDKILTNVSKNINSKLEDEQIDNLNRHFESKDNFLITKKDLGIAVRKFISRFLVGENFKNIESNILDWIKEKNELWNEKILSKEYEEQFDKEMKQLYSIDIKIKQSIDFYEKLGGERAEESKINKNENLNKKDKKKKRKGKREMDY